MNTVKAEFDSNYSLITSVQKTSDHENKIFYGIEARFPEKIIRYDDIEARFPEKIIRYDDITSDREKITRFIQLLNTSFVDEIQFEYILDDFIQSLFML